MSMPPRLQWQMDLFDRALEFDPTIEIHDPADLENFAERPDVPDDLREDIKRYFAELREHARRQLEETLSANYPLPDPEEVIRALESLDE